MARETDTLENQITYGNLSILPNINVSDGDGSLEVYGKVYTDTILSNTTNGNVNLEGTLFDNNTIIIPNVSTPTNVVASSQMFYTDTVDNKFKSINTSGLITVYQPTTTKGDLIVHDGTTTTRLPTGSIGQILTVNPADTLGLQWQTPNNINFSSVTTTSIHIQRNDIDLTMPLPVGGNILSIYNMISTGCSGNYITAKSDPSVGGNITLLNSNLSLNTGNQFTTNYRAYHGLELSTTRTDIAGAYKYFDSSQFTSTVLTLTNTSFSGYSANTTGVFFINISNYIQGPCATFMICKSYSASTTANVTTLNSSPGTSPFTQLNVSWPSNSGLSISKTTTGYNGIYYIVDNFQYTNLQATVTLTGTSGTIIPASVFPFYNRCSFYLSVVSTVTNSPKAIFSASKNIHTNNGNISSTVSLGFPSNERLNLTWNTNSLLVLSKNGVNFDGNYLLTFTKIN